MNINWTVELYRGTLSVFALPGFYALLKGIYFLWAATGPLIDSDIKQGYLLTAGHWYAGFLASSGGLVWLLNRGRGDKAHFLTGEEET